MRNHVLGPSFVFPSTIWFMFHPCRRRGDCWPGTTVSFFPLPYLFWLILVKPTYGQLMDHSLYFSPLEYSCAASDIEDDSPSDAEPTSAKGLHLIAQTSMEVCDRGQADFIPVASARCLSDTEAKSYITDTCPSEELASTVNVILVGLFFSLVH